MLENYRKQIDHTLSSSKHLNWTIEAEVNFQITQKLKKHRNRGIQRSSPDLQPNQRSPHIHQGHSIAHSTSQIP